MITTKDRAKLRAIAQKTEPIVIIGKGGISDTVLESIGFVLDKRELVKIKLLPNSGVENTEAMTKVCEALNADPVQNIGKIIVIYKRSDKKGVKHVL